MTHLDDGQILTLRDDPGGSPSELSAHLASCPSCRNALDGARGQAGHVSRALASLDPEPWELEAARARVRLRVAAASAADAGAVSLPARRARRAAWSLSRAAGLVLLAAAGLSALPGSPVRVWMEGRREAVPTGAEARAATSDVPPPAPAAEEVGVRIPVGAGPLRVILSGVEPGTEIRVRWVPGREAAVLAPVGSRFTSGEGRMEAVVAPGSVVVELPAGVEPVSLVVDGRVLLRTTPSGLEVPGPAIRRTDAGITFRIPAP